MHQLRKAIEEGFKNARRTTNVKVSKFWPYRESLHVLDGVILYYVRVVIPTSLCSRVLQILHSAHQGVSAMESHARAIVFWPRITKDIQSLCNQMLHHKQLPHRSWLPYLQRSLSQYLQIWWMPLLTCR